MNFHSAENFFFYFANEKSATFGLVVSDGFFSSYYYSTETPTLIYNIVAMNLFWYSKWFLVCDWSKRMKFSSLTLSDRSFSYNGIFIKRKVLLLWHIALMHWIENFIIVFCFRFNSWRSIAKTKKKKNFWTISFRLCVIQSKNINFTRNVFVIFLDGHDMHFFFSSLHRHKK